MTEEEAKTKWCPLVDFQIGPTSSSVWQGIAYNNRGQEYAPDTCRCIASECMWWVWDAEFKPVNLAKEGMPAIWASGTNISTTNGHCGAVRGNVGDE
jgi:hypothetical protein